MVHLVHIWGQHDGPRVNIRSTLAILYAMWVWQWLQAGILGGEQLWAVDGIAVDSLTRDEAGAILRGPIGSMVSHLLPLISFLPNKHLQVMF